MSQADWELLNQRRSCSLLARRAIAQGGTPTTPTTASVIGAMQVQEFVKHLHGLPSLFGSGVVFDGREHASYRVAYPIAPDCPWHEAMPAIEEMPYWSSATPLMEVYAEAVRRLGGCDALDLSRELVEAMECVRCGTRAEVFRSAEKVNADQLICEHCGQEASPVFFHSVPSGSPHLQRSAHALGVPPWDVIWARFGDSLLAFELSGDRPVVAGDLQDHPISSA